MSLEGAGGSPSGASEGRGAWSPGGAQREAAAGVQVLGHGRLQVADLMSAKPESVQASGSPPVLPGCVVLGESPHVPEPRPPVKWDSHGICPEHRGVGSKAAVVGWRGSSSEPVGRLCLSFCLNSTKRVDHSNTRLVTQLDRNPGVYSATRGPLGQRLRGEGASLVILSICLSVLGLRR